MAQSGYRYAAGHLAQAQSAFDVQKQNLGMLEINVDQLIPGGKEILVLSLQQFSVPGRVVGVGDLHYLNGVVRYPTKPEPQGNITVTYRDFPQSGTRSVLHEWFKLVYNEVTGLMLPTGAIKRSGFLVLFASDGTQERTAEIEGLWPTKDPDVAIEYSTGEHLVMEMEFAVDRIVWQPSLTVPGSASVPGNTQGA
jgi:hypothetical protein